MTGKVRVAMVCTGNICRSPLAEVIFGDLIEKDPALSGRIEVSSAGTANWHVGKEMDPRARRALDRAGVKRSGTLANYASSEYLNSHDIVIVMTREHRSDVLVRLTNQSTEVVLLREILEPGCTLDVHDPYYGEDSDFDECLDLIRQAGLRWTSEFRQQLDADSYEA